VNQKGFLTDGKDGNIIDRSRRRTMFKKDQLDENGDLPGLFAMEKFNFNPLDIMGNLDYHP